MMSFQLGDEMVLLKGKHYSLRLTMGALAELNTRLSVKGPQELSLRLRTLSSDDGRVLLACVMRPCLPIKSDHIRLAANFSDREISQAVLAVCRLFEEAFA